MKNIRIRQQDPDDSHIVPTHSCVQNCLSVGVDTLDFQEV